MIFRVLNQTGSTASANPPKTDGPAPPGRSRR